MASCAASGPGVEREFLELGPLAEGYPRVAAAAGVFCLQPLRRDVLGLVRSRGAVVAGLQHSVVFGRFGAEDLLHLGGEYCGAAQHRSVSAELTLDTPPAPTARWTDSRGRRGPGAERRGAR